MSAQDIDTNKYKQTADYVIAYYVKAYMEKKLGKTWGEQNIKNEWETIKNNSFDTPTSEEDIERLLSKLPTKTEGGNENPQQLSRNFYDKIKNKRDAQLNIDELTEIPINYEKYLKLGNSLKDELAKKLSNVTKPETPSEKEGEPKAKEPKKDTIPKISKRQRAKTNQMEKSVIGRVVASNRSLPWKWLLIPFIIIGLIFWQRRRFSPLIITAITFMEKTLKNIKDRKISTPSYVKTQEKNNYTSVYDDYKQEIQRLNDRIKVLEEEGIKSIGGEKFKSMVKVTMQKNPEFRSFVIKLLPIDELKLYFNEKGIYDDNINYSHTTEKETVAPSIVPQNESTVLYADSIVEGLFNEVRSITNEDSIYKLNLRTVDMATFTLLTDRYSRIVKRPEFLNGCDKQIFEGGRDIKILQEGETQRNSEGKWKITKKLSILIN